MTSDSQLQHDARLELVREPGVDADRIEVQVCDGVITLIGNVRSELEAWRAADAVLRVPGVRAVVNEAMVAGETPDHPRDDADIARPWFPAR